MPWFRTQAKWFYTIGMRVGRCTNGFALVSLRKREFRLVQIKLLRLVRCRCLCCWFSCAIRWSAWLLCLCEKFYKLRFLASFTVWPSSLYIVEGASSDCYMTFSMGYVAHMCGRSSVSTSSSFSSPCGWFSLEDAQSHAARYASKRHLGNLPRISPYVLIMSGFVDFHTFGAWLAMTCGALFIPVFAFHML